MAEPITQGEFLNSCVLDNLALEDTESTASESEEVAGPVGYDFEPVIATGETYSVDETWA